jgi:hypothetical protein
VIDLLSLSLSLSFKEQNKPFHLLFFITLVCFTIDAADNRLVGLMLEQLEEGRIYDRPITAGSMRGDLQPQKTNEDKAVQSMNNETWVERGTKEVLPRQKERIKREWSLEQIEDEQEEEEDDEDDEREENGV